ncbi:hypothetical protein NRY95_11060 [Xanthomonas campestris pv. phormiicola]|nr:hypothetical protein [Xanthomonas campestris pv. phormiicola]UYC18447.1 hypothetical protein NRY95_11060 [Xanthomonas campestris pv. phormiicola]
MKYTIAFTFSTVNDNDTLSVLLNITGNSAISLLPDQLIQIQQVQSQIPTPPLASLEVGQTSISVRATQNTSDDPQSIKIIVPVAISSGASSLTGNFPSTGVLLTAQYQFIDYQASGHIAVGDFSIPLPNH